MNLFKNCTSKSWISFTLSLLFSALLPPANAQEQETVTITVGVANKLEVALAVGPTEVDYSTFESDLRKILENKYVFTLPQLIQKVEDKPYNPPVPDHDLFVTAAKAVSTNTTKEFKWWVYDHNRPVATYGGSSVINEAEHSYMEAPPWVTTSATGAPTTASGDYLNAVATSEIWGPKTTNTTIVNTVGNTNYCPGIGYQYEVLGQTNPDPTNPDLGYYNTSSTNRLRHPYVGNNVHMLSTNNGSQMDFYGYPNYSYKDFRYLPSTQKTIKTFEFAIAEDAAYDALDGVGFFFNTHITETGYNSNTQRMSGYLLFLQYYFSGTSALGGDGWVGASDFKLGRGFKMALYKFENVDTKIFHHTGVAAASTTGSGALSSANLATALANSSGGSGYITKIAENTTLYNAGIGASIDNTNPDFTRRIKIEAAPTKVTVWYKGSKNKNDAAILNNTIGKEVNPVNWTIQVDGALPASGISVPAQNSGSVTTTVRLDASIIKGYGFGPMASYVGHNCARPTHIALQDLSMTMDRVRSLTEVVREPDWKENTKKFLVNLNEAEIEDFSSTSITGELLNRLRNDDIYYIGWCSDENATKSKEFLKKNDLKGKIVNIQAQDTTEYQAQMKAIADEIWNRYWKEAENDNPVVLVTDRVVLDAGEEFQTNTADWEYPNGKWKIVHNYNGFDTPDGVYPLSGQFVSDLDLQFNRVGEYAISFRDHPIISITAHKAPVAAFNVTLNGNKPSFEDKSYDPDVLTDGIVSAKWSYLNIEEQDAQLVKVSSITQLETELAMLLLGGKTYLVILDVEDNFGATASIAKQIRYVASYDPDASAAVTGVTISPASVTVKKGETQQFTAILTIEGDASESVTWSISGNVSPNTGIDPTTGLLTIDPDESATTLIVTAISDFDPTQQNAVTITISSESVVSEVITVIVTPLAPTVEKGEQQQFAANVATQGGASESVVWSISGNKSSLTIISTTGNLTVGAGETASTLTVKATSTADPKKYGVSTVTVVDPPAVISVAVIPASVDVRIGATQQFTAIVTVQGNASEKVDWSITSVVLPGTNINQAGLLTIDPDETALTINVVATSSPSALYSQESGMATVNVKSSGETVTSVVIAVSVTPSSPSVHKGTTQQFTANVATQGGASDVVAWAISGNVSPNTGIDPITGLLTIDPDETAATLTVTATSSEGAIVVGTAMVKVTESPYEAPFANFDIYPYTILKGVGNQNITIYNNSYDLQGLAITCDFTLSKDDETVVDTFTEAEKSINASGLNKGDYIVKLVVNNGYKNSVPVTRSFSVIVDEIPPTASASESTYDFTKNSTITLTFSDTGGSGFKEQRILVTTSNDATPSPDDPAWTLFSFSSSRIVPINNAGTSYIYWEATDNAGKSAIGYFGPYTLTKQQTPPFSLTASPLTEATYPEPITLTASFDISAFTQNDNVPTGSIYFFIDGVNIGSAPIITEEGNAKGKATLTYNPTLKSPFTIEDLPIEDVTFSVIYQGNSNYEGANASKSFYINKNETAAVTTITIEPAKEYDGAPLTTTGVTVTSDTGAAGDNILYTTVYVGRDGTTYGPTETPPVNAGKYTVTVTTADPRYEETSDSKDFEISQREISLSLATDPDETANALSDVALTVTIEGAVNLPGGLPAGKIRFSYLDEQGTATQIGTDDVAITYSDGVYSATLLWTDVPEGVYLLKAEYITENGDNYSATDDAIISGFAVVKQEQTEFGFTIGSEPITKWLSDDDFFLEVDGELSSGTLTFTVTEGNDVVEVDPETGKVTIIGSGTAVVTATKIGDDIYQDAIVSATIIVSKLDDAVITVDIQIGKPYDGEPFDPQGIVVEGTSKYEITYTGRDETIYDSKTPPTLPGKYTVTVVTTDPMYEEKSAAADFEIFKIEQPDLDFNFPTSEPMYILISEGSIFLQVDGVPAGTVIYTVEEGEEIVSIDTQTGEVILFDVGLAVIKVTIPGNDIYHPAVALLTLIVGSGSDETDIMADDKAATQVNENTFSVIADCGKDMVTIKVNTDPFAIVEFNNLAQREQTVNLPKYGDNIFDIKVTLQGNERMYTLIVVRNYDHVEYEYYDVPTVNCNATSNGGFVFNDFQWYQNDVAISGANKPYYMITNANDTYWCELTLSNNEKLRTCILSQNQKPASILSAYPNPTQGLITISNNEQVSTGKIQVFDVHGRIVLQTNDNPLDMSALPEGVYLIKLNDETVRVVLKK